MQFKSLWFTLGVIQVLRNTVGVEGVSFPGKSVMKVYDSRFNVISVTRGWVGFKFLGKKHYVTRKVDPESARVPLAQINRCTVKQGDRSWPSG